MRAKIFIALFIILSLPSIRSQYYFSEFKVGMFNFHRQTPFYNNTIYSQINNLQVRQIIKYSYHRDFNTDNEGGFYDPVSSYNGVVSGWINELIIANQQVLLEREKIIGPAYGQQSDYQAEIQYTA